MEPTHTELTHTELMATELMATELTQHMVMELTQPTATELTATELTEQVTPQEARISYTSTNQKRQVIQRYMTYLFVTSQVISVSNDLKIKALKHTKKYNTSKGGSNEIKDK